jgi:hypothetical protein
MYISLITILASWIIFSTILVTLILINSSRMSRTEDPETGQSQSTGELQEKRDGLVNLIRMLID